MGVFFYTAQEIGSGFFPARGYCGEDTMGVFFPHGSGTREFIFSGRRLLWGGNYGRFFPTRFRNSEVCFFRHEAIAGRKLWAFFFHTAQELGSLFFPARGYRGEETMGVFFPHGSGTHRNSDELESGFFPARGYCGEETMGVFFPHPSGTRKSIFSGTRLLRRKLWAFFFQTVQELGSSFFPARGFCGEETMGVFFPHGSGTRKFVFSGTRPLRGGNYGPFFFHTAQELGSLFFPARLLRKKNYGRFFSHTVQELGSSFFPARGHCEEETMGVFFHTGQEHAGTRKFIFFRHEAIAGRKLWAFFSHTAQELGSLFFPARGYCGEETMGVFLRHGSGTREFVFSGMRLLRGGNYARFFPRRFRNSEVRFFRYEAIAGRKLWTRFRNSEVYFFQHEAIAGRKLWGRFFPTRFRNSEVCCFRHEAIAGRKLCFFATRFRNSEVCFSGTRLLRGGEFGSGFFPARGYCGEETMGVFFPHDPHGSGTLFFS